ncbi:hypothetical protein A6E02_07065 [Aliivibrio fischeri]|nr:hypothetical protein [Aliivibrio fischeri]OCH36897.1 hypothetical protein A6E02_07065 [Aliivibrio fischeri]OED56205.1 hypothetical protein BEI47_14445 [Aliivibrio fischeri]
MKNKIRSFVFLIFGFALLGCANDEPLGKSVYVLKDEQTYNKSATEDNLGYIPTGSALKPEQDN